MYQTRQDDYISNFELTSLAFADLIVSEINADPGSIEMPKEEPKLAHFETIRCICGHNDVGGELIQCSECQCYLHRDCVELQNQRTTHFKCPFCKLQLDGTDPFIELKTWIDDKNAKIKSIHNLLTEASQLDQKIHASAYEYSNPNARNQNINMYRQNMTRNLQDAIDLIRNLSIS